MEKQNKLPLEGLNVLDLTTAVAAPTAGRLLAVYGANAIKVETPPGGDLLRSMATGHQLPTGDYNSPLFDVYNAGKRLVSINLKNEKGQEAFHRLLAKTDIFLSNVRMKSLIKMKLGYDDLKEKYPGLVYGHFSGFGLTGPDAERPGFDVTAFWPRSGAVLDWNVPDSFAIRPSFGFGDITSAGYFLSGILMALYSREKSGQGSLVSTSLLASGIWTNSASVINAQPQFGKVYPVERYSPWDPFSDFFECADGKWISVAGKSYEASKEVYAKLFDLPELLSEPEYKSLATMRDTGKIEAVSKRVTEKILSEPSGKWIEAYTAADIPYEILSHFSEVYEDEQANAIGAFDEVDYPEGGKTAMPMPPIDFPEYGRVATKPLGPVGRDTDEVLRELGYSEEEIAALRADRAVL